MKFVLFLTVFVLFVIYIDARNDEKHKKKSLNVKETEQRNNLEKKHQDKNFQEKSHQKQNHGKKSHENKSYQRKSHQKQGYQKKGHQKISHQEENRQKKKNQEEYYQDKNHQLRSNMLSNRAIVINNNSNSCSLCCEEPYDFRIQFFKSNVLIVYSSAARSLAIGSTDEKVFFVSIANVPIIVAVFVESRFSLIYDIYKEVSEGSVISGIESLGNINATSSEHMEAVNSIAKVGASYAGGISSCSESIATLETVFGLMTTVLSALPFHVERAILQIIATQTGTKTGIVNGQILFNLLNAVAIQYSSRNSIELSLAKDVSAFSSREIQYNINPCGGISAPGNYYASSIEDISRLPDGSSIATSSQVTVDKGAAQSVLPEIQTLESEKYCIKTRSNHIDRMVLAVDAAQAVIIQKERIPAVNFVI